MSSWFESAQCTKDSGITGRVWRWMYNFPNKQMIVEEERVPLGPRPSSGSGAASKTNVMVYVNSVVNQASSVASFANSSIPQGTVLSPVPFVILISNVDADANHRQLPYYLLTIPEYVWKFHHRETSSSVSSSSGPLKITRSLMGVNFIWFVIEVKKYKPL